jgi:hypothetical protein
MLIKIVALAFGFLLPAQLSAPAIAEEVLVSKVTLAYVERSQIRFAQRKCDLKEKETTILEAGLLMVGYDEKRFTCDGVQYIPVATETGLLAYIKDDNDSFWNSEEIAFLREGTDSIWNIIWGTHNYALAAAVTATAAAVPLEKYDCGSFELDASLLYKIAEIKDTSYLLEVPGVSCSRQELDGTIKAAVPAEALKLVDLNTEDFGWPLSLDVQRSRAIALGKKFKKKHRTFIDAERMLCDEEVELQTSDKSEIEGRLKLALPYIDAGTELVSRISHIKGRTVKVAGDFQIYQLLFYVEEKNDIEELIVKEECPAPDTFATMQYWARPTEGILTIDLRQKEFLPYLRNVFSGSIVVGCYSDFAFVSRRIDEMTRRQLSEEERSFLLSKAISILEPDSFVLHNLPCHDVYKKYHDMFFDRTE